MSPPKEGRRCWTLQYADEAQFHMDLLPALPDGAEQSRLLERAGYARAIGTTAIAITDKEGANYQVHSGDWPNSNPKGYARWFHSRSIQFRAAGERKLLIEAGVEIDDVPEYAIKTPLQSVVQILKYHRDLHSRAHEHRPISIIITTLAAHAYRGEESVAEALVWAADRMLGLIEVREGVHWVPNPADPRENFADKWATYPQRKAAFLAWLVRLQGDIRRIVTAPSNAAATEAMLPAVGKALTERAGSPSSGGALMKTRPAGRLSDAGRKVLAAPHRQRPPWPEHPVGRVWIAGVEFSHDGRTIRVRDDGFPLPSGGGLTFEAKTDVEFPYTIHWQVTNTGRAAAARGDLRGDFISMIPFPGGRLGHYESTKYPGAHGIECFVVKEGTCVARGGVFPVVISK